MKKLLLFALILFSISCATAQIAETSVKASQNTAANVWNPQKTWVFFVGLLEWQDKETFASFPQENRRDAVLLNVLRQRGVPENQIIYLKDEKATTSRVQKTFENFLQKPQPGDWIFVYYAGHGYKSEDYTETFMAAYDADEQKTWNVTSVPDTIDKYFKGSNALIMLDNCYSGAMAEAVKSRKSKVSYAVLASSHYNSFSTGNWTFTESLIYAFRGDSFIDDNSDGKINLGELAENSADDMLFAEEQLAEFAFTGNLNKQVIIAENVPKASFRVGERVEVYDQGDWYRAIITESEGNEFKVHFFGYEYDEDAWRKPNQIRKFKPKSFAVGSLIEAEYEKKWYRARVLQVKGGAHLIRYDDFDTQYDEWISSDRIRRRKR